MGDLRDLSHELRPTVHRADDGGGRGLEWRGSGGRDGLQAWRELEGHRRDRLHDRGPASAAGPGPEILEQGAKVSGMCARLPTLAAHCARRRVVLICSE